MLYKPNNKPEFSFSSGKIEEGNETHTTIDMIYGKADTEFLLTISCTLTDMLGTKTITPEIAVAANQVNEFFQDTYMYPKQMSKQVTKVQIRETLIGKGNITRIGSETMDIIRKSKFPTLSLNLCVIFASLNTKTTFSVKYAEGINKIIDYLHKYEPLRSTIMRSFNKDYIYTEKNGVSTKVTIRSLLQPKIKEPVPEPKPSKPRKTQTQDVENVDVDVGVEIDQEPFDEPRYVSDLKDVFTDSIRGIYLDMIDLKAGKADLKLQQAVNLTWNIWLMLREYVGYKTDGEMDPEIYNIDNSIKQIRSNIPLKMTKARADKIKTWFSSLTNNAFKLF
jgi:hypothetical protein